jgi:sugar phosphate isomerase/epimerase
MSMDKETLQISRELFKIDRPFAITMWEFSWIERRWPGAGYEDWDEALTQLKERGYDAVRIDAFPHLMAKDPHREWLLKPVWNLQVWGSPSINRIVLYDDFRMFLAACRRHGIRVGLSTWFRQDEDMTLLGIRSPEKHAEIWIKTLDYIREWGELDNILYVDLCNEWPLGAWAPFFTAQHGEVRRESEASTGWMRAATAMFKKAYPDIPVTLSFCTYHMLEDDMSYLDFIEPHIWMANSSEFYGKVGYTFARFDDTGYTNLQRNGERIYREDKAHYDGCLVEAIERIADWSRRTGKPLVTTECWSVVDYKDWPLLNWDWILELNELGVRSAAATGRWAGIATSNFCGPQFVGMWREVQWHRDMTGVIHSQG